MPVNFQALRVQFQKQVLNTNQFKGLAQGIAQRRVNVAQQAMLDTFENHRVTQEIEGGANYNGDSVIQYFSSEGTPNLYSFIGFSAGTDPVKMLKALLQRPIEVRITTRRDNSYYFRVLSPSVEDIQEATPMPDEYFSGSFSWAQGVEDGDLVGIGQYLSIKTSASRSGGGIQMQFLNTGSSVTATPYVTEILEAFRKKLQELSS